MNRKTGIILLVLTGLLLAGLVAFNLLVQPPQPAALPQAVVGSLVGQVEVRRSGQQRWQPVVLNQTLVEGDEIRTGLFSEAAVFLTGGASVTVDPNSTFVVGQEATSSSRFELGEGSLTAAAVGASTRALEFRSRGSDAIALLEQGELGLATDGKGTVLVDALAGQVTVKAAGEKVDLGKGRRSVVLPNKPPSRAMAIPASVALQVRWPAGKLDKTTTRLSGKTSVGALVLVNGIAVRADPEGNFELDIPLREGSNRLVVTATDPSGRAAARESPEILVDTRPPDVRVDAQGLWK